LYLLSYIAQVPLERTIYLLLVAFVTGVFVIISEKMVRVLHDHAQNILLTNNALSCFVL